MTTLDYAKPTPVQRRWVRTALIVLGGIGVTAIVFCVAGWLVISQMMSGPKVALLDFDSVKWQAASEPDATHNSVRLRMADSFLDGQQPIGKSREQIVALLGEPDDTPYFNEYDMVYYLGPERGPMGIDSEWLVLKLTRGSVTEARLATD
ncbi:MAG: hypothetical protein WBD40_22305 [Tepidisphaeraceae bacterium]